MDNYLERICAALERIADGLDGCATPAATGDAPKPRGRPRKVATADPVPLMGEATLAPAAVAPPTALPSTAVPAAVAPTGSAVHPVEELQKLVGYVCSKGLATAVKAIFTEFGVERASAIPADKRDAAFDKIKALLPVENLAA